MLYSIVSIPVPRAESFRFEASPPHQIRHLPGTIINGVTYESYNITIYLARDGKLKPGKSLLTSENTVKVYMEIRHGGGTEYFQINEHVLLSNIESIFSLDDRSLYSVFFMLYSTEKHAFRKGWNVCEHDHRKAFVDGRLKKRKTGNRYKVWIEPENAVTDNSLLLPSLLP